MAPSGETAPRGATRILAANDVFHASALIFLLRIPVVWLARPKRGGGLCVASGPSGPSGGSSGSSGSSAADVSAGAHGVLGASAAARYQGSRSK